VREIRTLRSFGGRRLRRDGGASSYQLIVKVLDKPGMLGDVALVMAQANINIDSIYVTTKGHVVLGVDDLDGAIQVAAGMAVMAFE